MVEVALDREDGGQKTSVNGRGCISMRQQVEQKTEAGGKVFYALPHFLWRTALDDDDVLN